jgi:rhodanese-related sulfurtransferase
MFDRLLIATSNCFFACINSISRSLRGHSVADISTEELQALQAGLTGPDDLPAVFVLVDVRSEAEYAVSMIPGAITRQQYECDESKYTDRLVIPYCTVGGRSYLYARQLVKAGVQTRNYKPGILGWCQAKLPLVTSRGEDTNRVHVYSSVFNAPVEYVSTTEPPAK